MKKILITGGAGFIGAHTAVQFSQAGFEVVIVDNLSRADETLLRGMTTILGFSPVFAKGDCTDKAFLQSVFEQHGPFSTVLHFAAYKAVGESVAAPLLYYRNNVGSLIALLEAMEEANVRDFIFSSSCTVYGQPDVIPVSERAPFKNAESPYGASKQFCERILKDVSDRFRIVSLRYFNPIGAHPSAEIGELPIGTPNNLVPYITQTAAGVRKELVIFGDDYGTPDGTCIRDFIHVVDLANAHLAAMRYLSSRPSGEKTFDEFNLGTGIGVSVLTLVNEFMAATKISLPFRIGPRRPGDVEKVFADPSKANKMLAWKTDFSLRDSLLHAWNWEKKIRHIS